MKKFFAIAAIATVLVACGDEKKTTEETKVVGDTISNAATEAANAADTTGKAAMDTFKTVVDTLKK
ncbi:MAG: hypothetical protein E6H07_18145 [Bacteroidetes bacterium]|nr:MAG: hypothetical protein E6H07_18145 [Bacteroidota bacterium]